MGEYARQYTLERFGVDIGDSDREEKPRPQKPHKPFGCTCGRMFVSLRSMEQHQASTKCEKTKRQKVGLT